MKKPNVIFILADDMGYGDFGFFNNGLSETPALDGLIKDGVCFTQHYSASPVCNPARASLMTGRYPHRTGSIDTLDMNGLDRLALDETTIADVLNSNGYATGLIGKWHLGAIDPRYHPNRRGFDEFAGFRAGWQDYYRWNLYYNEKFVRADGRYLTDVFTEEAVAFVKRHRNEPFFLHLTYNAPHRPLQAPEEDLKLFTDREKFTKGVSRIYAMIRRMDTGVDRLLDELKKLGLADNTIVFFTSDNGPQFGGEGDESIVRYNHGFRGCKGNVYEGGIRVPMIIRHPSLLWKGGMINEMVHFVDWFPTILDVCGIEITSGLKKLDGKSILPLLKGKRVDCGKRFWQWNRLYPVRTSNIAMRDGRWKLLRPPIPVTMEFPHKFGEIKEVFLLNRIYEVLRLYSNFFQPQMKLIKKTRVGSKVTRKYDRAQTPLQRILNCRDVKKETKQLLHKQYLSLNPVHLRKQLSALQNQLYKTVSKNPFYQARQELKHKKASVVGIDF